MSSPEDDKRIVMDLPIDKLNNLYTNGNQLPFDMKFSDFDQEEISKDVSIPNEADLIVQTDE